MRTEFLNGIEQAKHAKSVQQQSWFGNHVSNPDAKLRLFCFPYAGGDQVFRRWEQHLPETVELYSVRLPGRGMRLKEPPFTSMVPLVRAIAENIIPLLDKPFALFGHSMGAKTSFELARELKRTYDINPVHLFVGGSSSPEIVPSTPPTYDLPDPEFIESLRKLNGTPREVLENQELIQIILPILRADITLCQTYTYSPGPALDCPITVYSGLEDQEVDREGLEAWRKQTNSSFSLYQLPGDHFFLRTSQTLLLNLLSRELRALTDTI